MHTGRRDEGFRKSIGGFFGGAGSRRRRGVAVRPEVGRGYARVDWRYGRGRGLPLAPQGQALARSGAGGLREGRADGGQGFEDGKDSFGYAGGEARLTKCFFCESTRALQAKRTCSIYTPWFGPVNSTATNGGK